MAKIESFGDVEQKCARHDAAVDPDIIGCKGRTQNIKGFDTKSTRSKRVDFIVGDARKTIGINVADVRYFAGRELTELISSPGETPTIVLPPRILPVRMDMQANFMASAAYPLDIAFDRVAYPRKPPVFARMSLEPHDHSDVDVKRQPQAMLGCEIRQHRRGPQQAVFDATAPVEKKLVVERQYQGRRQTVIRF